MTQPPRLLARAAPLVALAMVAACGREPAPTAPSAQTSFLTGTATIQS